MSYAVPNAGGRHRTDRDPFAVAEAASSVVADSSHDRRPGRLKGALQRIGQGLGNRPVHEAADLACVVELPSAEPASGGVETLPERLPTREAAQSADVEGLSDLGNVFALPSQPCFDVTDVLHLAGELDDRLFPWHFAGRYREQLDPRVARIDAALDAGDLETALEVTLSLKVTSTLVGTRELAELASVIETELRTGNLAAVRLSAAELPAVAGRAADALRPYLSA